MKILFTCLIFFSCMLSQSCSSQSHDLTPYEKTCTDQFREFLKTLAAPILDSSMSFDNHVKHKIYSLLFINHKGNSTKDSNGNADSSVNGAFDAELNSFYQYLLNKHEEHFIDHIKLLPFRRKKNNLFEAMTNFQKENTFVYFDDRTPEKILGYVLFIPKMKNVDGPKIWSWTLTYKFGKVVFKSVEGKEGEEYLFSPDLAH